MKLTFLAGASAVIIGCVASANAQVYPSRPVSIIVPFPAGGPNDTLARILAERMKSALGQPVLVENVTGAGASIGVGRAAQAAPDGYTLSIGNWTSHVGSGAMYPVAHDALLELQPVSLISSTPLMIIGKNALPPKDAKDPTGAKAPGKPGHAEGFQDPDEGEKWVKNRNGIGNGWLDARGNVRVPTGLGGAAHAGTYWDVQAPDGAYVNVYPGGSRR